MPSAGDYVRASDTTRYYCKVTQANQQSINSAAFTSIIFDAADDVDSLGIHDPVTNNTQLNIGLKLGWWLVSGLVTWNTTAITSSRRIQVALNAGGVNGSFGITPAIAQNGFWSQETTTLVQATVSTDYVELQGYQDTGGALLTRVSVQNRCQLVALYLGA